MKNFYKYLPETDVEESWGFYATTIGYIKTQPNNIYPAKIHPSSHSFTWNKGRILNGFYLVYIAEGSGYFESAKTKARVLNSGTCFFLFPGVWHRYKPEEKVGWEEYWVGFKGSYPSEFMKKGFFTPENPFIEMGKDDSIKIKFHQLLDLVGNTTPGYQQIISGIILQIIGMLRSITLNSKDQEDSTERLISKAKFLMQESLNKQMNMKKLSTQLPMGYSKFRKCFKEITGESPKQYHLNLRLNKAKSLLQSTKLNINEVAYQTGFESIFYFSKLFKEKNNGKSPKAFSSK